MSKERIDTDISELLSCEHIRQDFEKFMNSLTHVRYPMERDEHDEYKQTAVFHMWTGYCISQKMQNQK